MKLKWIILIGVLVAAAAIGVYYLFFNTTGAIITVSDLDIPAGPGKGVPKIDPTAAPDGTGGIITSSETIPAAFDPGGKAA
jgi:hypothetical protein